MEHLLEYINTVYYNINCIVKYVDGRIGPLLPVQLVVIVVLFSDVVRVTVKDNSEEEDQPDGALQCINDYGPESLSIALKSLQDKGSP